MPDKLKAVLFDIGGVLIDGIDGPAFVEVGRVFRVAVAEAKGAVRANEDGLSTGKISEEEFWRRVAATLGKGLPPETKTLWHDIIKRHMKIKEDTMDIARRLRHAGYRTGIVSNTEHSHVAYMREAGLFNGFDPVILSCEVGLRKPDKGIFREAIKRLGLAPATVAYTDDNDDRMDGAKELGMHTHVFRSPGDMKAWLVSLGFEF